MNWTEEFFRDYSQYYLSFAEEAMEYVQLWEIKSSRNLSGTMNDVILIYEFIQMIALLIFNYIWALIFDKEKHHFHSISCRFFLIHIFLFILLFFSLSM
jgi:hypothetical protein